MAKEDENSPPNIKARMKRATVSSPELISHRPTSVITTIPPSKNIVMSVIGTVTLNILRFTQRI
ncbi:hypothetical protein JCM10003_3968 [Bacteroides pyogenes JCM 10003]|nr:hypothetical protein JCM10003_3968 [Bacteroides pyogenes JCM 10003]